MHYFYAHIYSEIIQMRSAAVIGTRIHGGSMKSKPNFVFHISTSNMETVFNIFVKKLSVVWFAYLIKEDVQNVLLLLARKPGGACAIGQRHRRLSSDPDHPILPTRVRCFRLFTSWIAVW